MLQRTFRTYYGNSSCIPSMTCYSYCPCSSSVAPAPPSVNPALSVPTADVTPGASPRKKPRKQQHVISTEESEMMETNSTDEEKPPAKPVSHRLEKRKSPPKEYIGQSLTSKNTQIYSHVLIKQQEFHINHPEVSIFL